MAITTSLVLKRTDYPIYSRKKEVFLPMKKFYLTVMSWPKDILLSIRRFECESDNKFASFGIDIVGRRIYTIQIKNLETGEILSDKIENATGNSVWANDNKTIFYTRQDKVTLRSDKVFKHKLATDAADDVLVFNERTIPSTFQ
jgi:oligopeptidase B